MYCAGVRGPLIMQSPKLSISRLLSSAEQQHDKASHDTQPVRYYLVRSPSMCDQ